MIQISSLELKRRYEAGETQRELAAAFNVSVGTIQRTLARASVQLRPRGSQRGKKYGYRANTLRIAAAIFEGQPVEETARKFNVGIARVLTILHLVYPDVPQVSARAWATLTLRQQNQYLCSIRAIRTAA